MSRWGPVGFRRVGCNRGALFGSRLLGRRRTMGMHGLSIHRRALPLSPCCAESCRRRGRIGSGSQSVTGFHQKCGGRSSIGSDRFVFLSSMLRRKAMFGSTISKARSDRSAACLHMSRFATRSRSSASTTARKCRLAPDGFCIRCADGEVGEALGRIGKEPGARFEGYSEEIETERKTLRDVFEPGDAWMRTGDLMRRDADGFYTFVERIGDTFRWKGENVSTSEVEAALRACPGVEEAVVYGVVVPGADGRAGMALLKIDRRFDLDALPGGSKSCRDMPDRFSCASPLKSRPRRPSNLSGAPMLIRASTLSASKTRFMCSTASDKPSWCSTRNGTPRSETAT